MKHLFRNLILGSFLFVANTSAQAHPFWISCKNTANKIPIDIISLKDNIGQRVGTNASLPEGAPADIWSLDDAWRQTTPTREKISMNGLWGFRPVLPDEATEQVPVADDGWGWCKVPAIWPDRREGDQAVQRIWFAPQIEQKIKDGVNFDQAWYKRKITVPQTFSGKHIILNFTMIQTHVKAFVDGIYAGELWFPGGELDLTKALTPGKEQEIALLVTARPFSQINQAFMGIDRITVTRAAVRLRGITGDLYLSSMPSTSRLNDAQVITSTSDGTITFVVETANLVDHSYQLRAEVKGCGERKYFYAKSLTLTPDSMLRFTAAWKNPKRWDTNTPSNRYTVTLTLLDAGGKTLDILTPIDFGFRDIRIEGRNFILNGTPIHLRLLNSSIMSATADKANTASAREYCRRLKQYGFNAIIASNYDFKAGSTAYIDGLLEACDEEGILFSFSLPHFNDFGGNLQKSENAEKYRQLCKWLVHRVRNHPSVIFYAMNHNSCGYFGDINPLKIDGIFEVPEGDGSGNAWWERNRPQARIAESIAESLDPSRPVYHHESGNLGSIHCSNVYLDWAPRQERSEWLEHWATVGVKPFLAVEWGLPHIANWSSYRGPKFIWSNAAFQSIWASEYAAQFWGDAAYQPNPEAIATLANEEQLWATGKEFTWQQLQGTLRVMINNYHNVLAYYNNDVWRSLRTWGISGVLPWDSGDFWYRISETPARPTIDNLKNLKRPGIVPDNLRADYLFTNDVNGDPAAFAPYPVGRTFLRWNMPDCAYIGGAPSFTDKTHLYTTSDDLDKTLIILNDRRTSQSVQWQCTLEQNGMAVKSLNGRVVVLAGGQTRVPVALKLPDRIGDYSLNTTFTFESNVVQTDTFRFRIVPTLPAIAFSDPIMLYDKKGITSQLFDRLHIPYHKIDNLSNLASMPIVIGRESLDENSVQWIKKQTIGKRILVMEQPSKQLHDLLGFRIAERGSRLFFLRYPSTITKDLDTEDLREWRGASTLLPEHLTDIDEFEIHNPQWQWCGQTSTRVWRCGNTNSVASVLIEKPSVGDWHAFIDGEFDLQYSPLLENVDSGRRIIFCQLDISGRTVPDPVADMMTIRILNELHESSETTMSIEHRACIALGDNAKKLVASLGIDTETSGKEFKLLVASPGAEVPENVHQQIYDGSNVLCLGMNAKEIAKWSPVPLEATFTNAYFTRIEKIPPELYGLSNADWAWHGKMSFYAFPMVPDGNEAFRIIHFGKGVIVFWQVPPWMIDERAKPYLRSTKRRANNMADRLIANLGAASSGFPESLYIDTPENVDDPYRYFKW